MANLTKKEKQRKVKIRIRKKIKGDTEKPRLAVHKSGKHIYAQIIDDTKAETLAFASSLSKEFKSSSNLKNGSSKEAAKFIGKLIAKIAKDKKISSVVFDRGGFLYHGRISELADSARENGLNF